MLKEFTLKNYKNFRNEIKLDLAKVAGYKFNPECVFEETIVKGIIYGRNATGKTNLGTALGDIVDVIVGGGRFYSFQKNRVINADTEDDFVRFKYVFQFDGTTLMYAYERNRDDNLAFEKLSINDEVIYEIRFEQNMFTVNNLELIDAETVQIDKFLSSIVTNGNELEMEEEEREQVPFLRYLLTNGAFVPESVLYKLEDYVKRMRFYSVNQQLIMQRAPRMTISFSDYLGEDDNLKHFEEFLNIMGIECELQTLKSAEGHFELFFKHKVSIPFFANASSGTLSLANFYMRYVAVPRTPSFIYMDEFDAFYHYEMAEKLVRYFKLKYPKTQIILTTHNTNLMCNQLMRPDCLFILSRDGRLTALSDATERELREGHNLEKLYIGGEFEYYE